MKTVDIFTNIDVHPDSRQLLVRDQQRSIAAALRLRVMVGRQERPFESVGSSVSSVLFENFSEQTSDHLRETIKEACASEKQAIVDDVEVIAQPSNNRYVINIYYRTAISQVQQKLQLTLYRVR